MLGIVLAIRLCGACEADKTLLFNAAFMVQGFLIGVEREKAENYYENLCS